jgi:hypothetical protein
MGFNVERFPRKTEKRILLSVFPDRNMYSRMEKLIICERPVARPAPAVPR